MRIVLALAISSITLFQTSQAQVTKGHIAFGGNISGSKTTIPRTSSTLVDGRYGKIANSISASYFLVDRVAAGLLHTYNFKSTKYGDPRNIRTDHTLAIGPLLRYYFPFNKFSFFAQSSLQYGKTVQRSSIFTNGERYKGTAKLGYRSIGFGGGATYFISEIVSVEGLVQFKQDVFRPKPKQLYVSGYTESGWHFSIGLNLYIDRFW